MGKVILICGKLCSGKSYYTSELLERLQAVNLSCDELMFFLFQREETTEHDKFVARIKPYLLKKACEIAAGQDVILDWGFWRESDRREVREYFAERNIPAEWHYLNVDDETWKARIAKRNAKILRGESNDYFVDEGLMKKFETMFDEPDLNEMDIIVNS